MSWDLPRPRWIVSLALIGIGCGKVTSTNHADATTSVDAVDAPSCGGVGPNPNFTYAPAAFGVATPVTFTPHPGLIYSWSFTAGTPPTSAVEMPTVTWSTPGAHVVTLAVTDPATTCSTNSMQDVVTSSCGAPLMSPTFNQTTTGHANAGIVFTATVNTTLTSFTVANQAAADTINLTDAGGTILQTLALPAAMASYNATVSWPLTMGSTYHLVTQAASNGRWVTAPTYPVAGGSISITSGWMDATLYAQYWFSFTNIVTCP